MTEVPEHLLQRSRERRAALGLGGGDSGAAPSPAAPSTPGAAVSPASDAPSPAPTPAAPPPAPVAPAPPPPPPPYVAAAMARPKIPVWAVPVLALLPIWAVVYAGALVVPEKGITDPVLVQGQGVYAQSCASCHGNDGGGGVGRPLSGGEVLLTFPDPAEHIDWVVNGSPPAGTPYGNPERPGGQHISSETSGGPMPPFGDSLTPEEILAVVRYEREILGGETESALAAGEAPPANQSEGTGEAESEGGEVGGEDQAGSATES
ncbi:MAG: cytochrome c [Actinomycetota bacterium]|nr:cytochrome c [Actinomycetota bacterium]